jgi:D-alanine transaminase
MTTLCYLNGEYLPLEEAKISPMDRGFIFGDGVYEVVACYGGKPFRMHEHLVRLQRSCDEIRLTNPLREAEWEALITRLIAGDTSDRMVYFQVTRGVAMKRDHRFPKGVTPTVFAYSLPLPMPTSEQIAAGLSCVSMDDFRWHKCHVKSTSLLGNVLARQAAEEAGADEVILFREGYLTEASACNIFVVRHGVVLVPPKNNLLLPGITDDLVVELMRAHGMRHEIRPVAEWEVRNADEIWITSTTKEALAVTRLDGNPVGRGDSAGRPGPLCEAIRAHFRAFKEQFVSETAHVAKAA